MSERKKDREIKGMVDIVPAASEFISVDGECCDGCGNCVSICPADVWKIRGGKAFPSNDYRSRCLECGSCFIACGTGALEFTYPEGGTGVRYRYA